ncbi:hypothetical protein HYV31_00750 [candidate division WWE3 bacterium]|nr:hypothetical protein [candidate division WWE3 bacterium]
MKSFLKPANLGDTFLFFGFLTLFYTSFIFTSAKVSKGDVLATCTSDGAYGQTCTNEENFTVEKKVRIKGNTSWQDKVINVKEVETVEFRITVKNVGDESESKMKTIDLLPDELSRTGGAGLTEVWDDFNDGDSKEFIIESKLKSSEFQNTKQFEKCVVNKVDLYQNEDHKGSDTATVCYNNAKVEELPKTGPIVPIGILGIIGVGLGFAGSYLKTLPSKTRRR